MPNDYPRSKPGTKSRFGRGGARDSTERRLPSYQQQDREQGERDLQAERKENDREDEDIDRKAGKEDEKKTKDVKATKPSGKERVTDNVNRTRAPAITNTKVGGAYSRVWGLSSHYSFYEPRFQNNNYFIPNALPLQQLLEIAVPLVARSNWIQKYEFTFNPYAVMVGYSYIYYIQIARAKKAAMDLKGREVSALSRFEKYNPFESIPIPDIFVPYYESIVATQMSDNKFSWIVPTWGFDDQAVPPVSWPSYAGFNAMTTVTFADFIRPNIPFMLSNLATFGAETGAGIFRHFDPERNFAPIEMDDGAVPPVRRAAARFMNENHNLGNAAGHSMSDFLNTCGTSIPFQFWNDNMREAQTYMKTSNFFVNGGIDTVLSTTTDLAAGAAYTNPVTEANMRQTKAITHIDEYLYVAKDNNPIWFSYIREQMAIFCAHFPRDLKTLADISVVGGMESTIKGQLKTTHRTTVAPVAAAFVHADYHIGRNNNIAKFYPRVFEPLKACFATPRIDIEREEALQAITFAINSDPPVLQANNNESIRRGKIFDFDYGSDLHMKLRIGSMELDVPGEIPMFSDWNDYVRDDFESKPI